PTRYRGGVTDLMSAEHSKNMKRVVIIGGGITGLAAAHRVLELTRESSQKTALTILESSNRVGGIVETHARDGFLLESGPDSFISEKPAALDLARRLGLHSRIIETNANHRRSLIVRRGRLLPVPEGFHLLAPSRFWPFVKSDIFSWIGKARMALDLILPRRIMNGSARVTNDESLADFVRRRLGREALDRMAQPMVGGIYTADPEQLSLLATMPRFLEMERDHRSVIRALRQQGSRPTVGERLENDDQTNGARYSLFLSFDRGMQVLTDTLAERISYLTSQIVRDSEVSENAPALKNAIRLNTPVESISLVHDEAGVASEDSPRWIVKTAGNETLSADAICLALPSYVSARLLDNIDSQLASELDGIPYASSATINLAFRREDVQHPLDSFGFVVPFSENRSIIACTFSSVKFAARAPSGSVLLRAFAGGALQPEILKLDDSELLSRVRMDLRDLLGIEQTPLFAEVSRWHRSMPQYHLGHIERVKRIERRAGALPGLVLAGNAYTGLGIPDCIRNGEAAAEQIWDRRNLGVR
ncbi:MAG TPA: protoporphyrinogen oxidase, partial [Pyrinomonadaceae bacterium]|nr:protoporphyrinogen oxidase [Pyrinomonadaceae bacterium]